MTCDMNDVEIIGGQCGIIDNLFFFIAGIRM